MYILLHCLDLNFDINKVPTNLKEEIFNIRLYYRDLGHLYFIDLDKLILYPNLFNLICKYAVIQPTSSKVESSFSIMKMFVKTMPYAHVQTIANRVAMKVNVKQINLKDIMEWWLPKSER